MSYTYTTNNTNISPNITLTSATTTSGQIYTTNGTGGLTWANPNDNVMIVKNDPASLDLYFAPCACEQSSITLIFLILQNLIIASISAGYPAK